MVNDTHTRRRIDSVVDKVKSSGVGCYVNMTYMSILLYADDILLVAPSVTSLQRILSICEAELESLDMRVNPKKSSCICFGARFSVKCCYQQLIIANSPGVTTLDTSGFITGHQEHLPAPLVMLSNPCIVLLMQFLAKLGELHPRM